MRLMGILYFLLVIPSPSRVRRCRHGLVADGRNPTRPAICRECHAAPRRKSSRRHVLFITLIRNPPR